MTAFSMMVLLCATSLSAAETNVLPADLEGEDYGDPKVEGTTSGDGLDHARAEVDSWNQLRGPGGSGVAHTCQPPVKLDAGQLAWKTPAGHGLSSPVLAGNRIFLTAVEDGRLVTLAFDTASGKPAWRNEAPEVSIENVHKAIRPAASTPQVDDERVYVYFGSYGLLCYDHEVYWFSRKWKNMKSGPRTQTQSSTGASSLFQDRIRRVLAGIYANREEAPVLPREYRCSQGAAFHFRLNQYKTTRNERSLSIPGTPLR